MVSWLDVFRRAPAPPTRPAAQPASRQAPTDWVTAALHAALNEPADIAEARGEWADALAAAPDHLHAVRALIANLQASRLAPAALAVTDAARLNYPDQDFPNPDTPPEEAAPAEWVQAAADITDPPAAPPSPITPQAEETPSVEATGERVQSPDAANPPSTPDPRQLELDQHIAAKRFDEAESLFASLPGELAGQEWYALAGLKLAQRAKNAKRTLHFAAELRAISPASPRGYGAASFALRMQGRYEEAEAIASAGLARCPGAPGLLKEAAELAAAAGQNDLAAERFAELRRRVPRQPIGFIGAIGLNFRIQNPEEAKRLIAEGLAACPKDREMLQLAAREAIRDLRWDDAQLLWQRLTAVCPDDASVALEAATAFIGPLKGRLRRLPAVLDKLTALHERFPRFVPAYVDHLGALREASRLDEAQALGEMWIERFPNNIPLAVACARVAEDRGTPGWAIGLLERVRTDNPPNPNLEVAYIRALSFAGQEQEAERLCLLAKQRFPGDHRVIEQHVALATRRGDFAEAAARVEAELARLPANPRYRRMAERLRALSDDGPAEQPATAPSDRSPLENHADLFLRFESLGATAAGCEFGVIQRRFGAESMGLLRWGTIPIEGLTSALTNSFEGFGDPETTRIVVQRASANYQEYYVSDDRYKFWGHTFIRAEDAPQDRILTQSLRLLATRRDKLVEDLRQARKIFVYKMTTDVGAEALDRLFDALRHYGDCVLLGVVLEDAAHPSGTVEMIRHGLFVGRVATFMGMGSATGASIDGEVWRSLCEQVAAWRDAQEQVSAA